MGWFGRKKYAAALELANEKVRELEELDQKAQDRNDKRRLQLATAVDAEATTTFEALPEVHEVKACPKCLGREFDQAFGPYRVGKSFVPEQLPSEAARDYHWSSGSSTLYSQVFEVLRWKCRRCEYSFMSKTADYIKPAVELTKGDPSRVTESVILI
jgi:rubrerythrin